MTRGLLSFGSTEAGTEVYFNPAHVVSLEVKGDETIRVRLVDGQIWSGKETEAHLFADRMIKGG